MSISYTGPSIMANKFSPSSIVFILRTFLLFILSSTLIGKSHAVALKDYPKLQAVADELIAEKVYTQAELDVIFSNATVQQSVLDAMKNPAEYKFTWGKYRKLFMQEERIQQGAEFWHKHQAEFDRAEKTYGVPGSIIAAIIGVESKYGKFKGKYKVLDSLVSLVIDFPRRSAFFAKELKQFLILTKENKLASDEILGSYAGAVGYPQFISSSYRNYAVDFSGDGIADLINQPTDAIGSVANYFVENGWLTGQPVTSRALAEVPSKIRSLANRKRKIQFAAGELIDQGAKLDSDVLLTEKLNVLMLDLSEEVNEPRSSNVYIVRAGDTACAIAERFETPCKTLFELNKLNDKGKIYRGQRLKLPQIVSQTKQIKAGKWSVNVRNQPKTMPKPEVSGPLKPVYFYTHENFYVITRYNHSVLYAMAVHELSQAIDLAKRELVRK